jgi:hypothetical protein
MADAALNQSSRGIVPADGLKDNDRVSGAGENGFADRRADILNPRRPQKQSVQNSIHLAIVLCVDSC